MDFIHDAGLRPPKSASKFPPIFFISIAHFIGLMKFFVVLGPVVKFLINKYMTNLSPAIISSEIIQKINNSEILPPSDISAFVSILQELHSYLTLNDLHYRVGVICKYCGHGIKTKGILKILQEMKHETWIYVHEPKQLQKLYSKYMDIFKEDAPNVQVLAPLNSDENEEIYRFFHEKIAVPIYPMIFNFSTSKWMGHITFAPLSPRCFFFPDETSALDYLPQIREIVEKEQIGHMILKDEYENDIKAVLFYAVTKINKLEHYIKTFYEKTKPIPNIGGLLLEEFLSNNQMIQLCRLHNYWGVLPKSTIGLSLRIKKIDNDGWFDSLIESTAEKSYELLPEYCEKINSALVRFYPYLFSGFDFILDNNTPKIIDINGISNSFVDYNPLIDVDAIFRIFLDKCVKEDNRSGLQTQLNYRKMITQFYSEVLHLGPCYISGNKLIQLDEMKATGQILEKNVQDIISELLSKTTH
jgi:hypothetical protein